MKNTKNAPGTYKLVVNCWDGRGSFGTIFTKPLTITRPIVDNALIRKFIDAGLYRRDKDNMWTIKRVN